MTYIPALKEQYFKSVLPELMKNLGYKNHLQAPRIEKIVINSGISASSEKGHVEDVVKQIAQITGQQPVITKARESISNFKLRQGMPVGVKVTLRGAVMWDFFQKLISIALPNTRDFRGIPATSFDRRGNYTLGIQTIGIFPEISSEGTKKDVGLDITIVTTAKTDQEGLTLLKLFGMPFRASKKTTIESNS
jgi:large subunit ribosomal protein L5